MDQKRFITLKSNTKRKGNKTHRVPIQSDNTVLLTDLRQIFPQALNLKYNNAPPSKDFDCKWVYLSKIDERFLPPIEGWSHIRWYHYDGIRNPEILHSYHLEELMNIRICPAFKARGSCVEHSANICPFIHGDKCDLCEMFILHPYNEDQQDYHRKECIKNNQIKYYQLFCSICLERIDKKQYSLPNVSKPFGLLDCCQHVYCIDCIGKWKMENNFTCPQCRKTFQMIIPSDHIVEDRDEKNSLIFHTVNPNWQSNCCM